MSWLVSRIAFFPIILVQCEIVILEMKENTKDVHVCLIHCAQRQFEIGVTV